MKCVWIILYFSAILALGAGGAWILNWMVNDSFVPPPERFAPPPERFAPWTILQHGDKWTHSWSDGRLSWCNYESREEAEKGMQRAKEIERDTEARHTKGYWKSVDSIPRSEIKDVSPGWTPVDRVGIVDK